MSKFTVDTDAIKQLADILRDTGLTEIEVSSGENRIRVARTAQTVQAMVPAPAAHAPAAAAPVTAPAEVADLAAHPGAVKSPMVGVAYLAPEPGAANFVSVGQNVAAGQTLLLIEAMKTFNQIKAPRAGVVSRVLISAGVPVEYGEVLMVLE